MVKWAKSGKITVHFFDASELIIITDLGIKCHYYLQS